MKKRLTKVLLLTLASALLLSLLVSCAAGSKAENDMGYWVGETETKGDGFSSDVNSGSAPSLGSEYERKIIKTANISAETKEFDKAMDYVDSLCTSIGGYVESSTVRGQSLNSKYSYRYANYTIRIPAESLDSFTAAIGGTLNVVSSSSNANEVTSAYYDIKSRLEVLELQKQSLQEMYDNYTDYKDIDSLLELQDKLFDVIAEIESYQTQIKLYDDQVAYSTVHLNISEVVDYTENKEDDTFFQKLGDAFVGGWDVFLDILSGISVALAFILPELVIGAVVVTVVLILTRKRRLEKKKAKLEKKENEK